MQHIPKSTGANNSVAATIVIFPKKSRKGYLGECRLLAHRINSDNSVEIKRLNMF